MVAYLILVPLLLAISTLLSGGPTPVRSNPANLVENSGVPTFEWINQEPADELQDLSGLRFDTLTAADGLSRSLVSDILQDQYGFMWFGTDYGLNRFDGHQFKIFNSDPKVTASLINDHVTDLFEDNQGNLWVGTAEGLDQYERSTESFVHYPSGRVHINSITEDQEGMIWLATNEGLKRINPADNTVKVYLHASDDPTSLSSNAVFDVLIDQEHRIWVGTIAGLDLWEPATDTFRHYQEFGGEDSSLIGSAVLQIIEDKGGQLWLTTELPGLGRFNTDTGSIEHFALSETGEVTSGMDRVIISYIDEDGDLWAGTASGLFSIESSDWSIVKLSHNPDDPRSLADNTILSILADRTGLLWVGTVGGLSKQNPAINRFKLIQESNEESAGLSDNLVTAVHEDRYGDVWIGTVLGDLDRLDLDTGKIIKYDRDPADPSTTIGSQIETFYEDPRGRLWLGTGAGLELFNPDSGSFRHYQLPYSQAVFSIAQLESGLMVLGTSSGLFSFDEERDFFSTIQGYQFLQNAIDDILVDRIGRLWIATRENGLWMATPSLNELTFSSMSQYKHDYDDPTSLGAGAVLSIAEDSQGNIWVGTLAGGLNLFNPETQTFSRYTSQNGLVGTAVTCIVVDQEDQPWLGSNIGISRFDPTTESFRNYGPSDGLQGAEFVTCHQGDDGTMFFGGLLGLNVFDPDALEENRQKPPIVITEVQVNGEHTMGQVLPGDQLELPYNENFINLEFSVLDFANPNGNRFAYKMDGLDQDWIVSDSGLDANYPDLKPGNYTFRVKGANSDGFWNDEGASLPIIIRPPFWQTWWFRGLIFLTLVIIVAVAFQLRARNLEARSRKLEALVDTRTLEVEERTREIAILEERQRLARDLHDSVTQSIYSLTLLTGATTRELTAGRLQKVKEYQQRQGQIAQDTLKEMRLLVYQLRPSSIASDGLIVAIQQRLDAVENRSGIDAAFEVRGDLDLAPDMEAELFNIVQEALNNALKHAEPESVSVALYQTDGQIALVISDDGCGFDPVMGLKYGGMGLESMHERAEKLGGTLTIESNINLGTTVRFDGPMSKRSEESSERNNQIT